MKCHTARPIVEDLEELYSIAVREHGPHARSSRWIRMSLEELKEVKGAVVSEPRGGSRVAVRRRERVE